MDADKKNHPASVAGGARVGISISDTNVSESPYNPGWFKAKRSQDALELIARNKNAFILAYFIARRANWRGGFNRDELGAGEAMLGDVENYDMSPREYRTAKKILAKFKFATFTETNEGTIAKLLDARLFEIQITLPDKRQTIGGQPSDKRQTTNKEQENERIQYRIEQRGVTGGQRGAASVTRPVTDDVTMGHVVGSFALNKIMLAPSYDEVKAHVLSRIRIPEKEIEQYFNRMTEQSWMDQHGQPIRNWKNQSIGYLEGVFKNKSARK